MKNAFLFTVAALSLFALFGCNVTKNMDEMHDSTKSMNDKMDQTNKGMQDTNTHLDTQIGISHELSDQTDQLYTDQRQGFSDQIRHQFLDALEKTHSMEAKLSEAGQYFMAFEFQLYKHFRSDTSGKLDSLYFQGVEEFFRTARRYIDDKYAIDVTTKNNNALSAAALAVMMYRVNPNLQNNAAVTDTEKVSILDLVERALELKPQLESGELRESDLKDWQREVLRHEQDAVYLLQLRVNFTGIIVLADATDIRDVGLAAKFFRLEKKYDTSLDHLANVEQIVTNTTYLTDANREKGWLWSHKYDQRMDQKLLKLYRNMNITAAISAPDTATAQQQRRAEAMKDLVAQIEIYRK